MFGLSRGIATEGTKFTEWLGVLRGGVICAGLVLWGRWAGRPFGTDGCFPAVVRYGVELRRWNMEKVLEVGHTERGGLTGWTG